MNGFYSWEDWEAALLYVGNSVLCELKKHIVR